MTTISSVRQVADGEELVFTSEERPWSDEPEARDLALEHRSQALAGSWRSGPRGDERRPAESSAFDAKR